MSAGSRTASEIFIFMALIIAAIAAVEWLEHHQAETLQARSQKDAMRREASDHEWREKHPEEAASLEARLTRSFAAMERSQEALIACAMNKRGEAYLDCVAENKRNEILSCLNGPDWRDCPVLRPNE